MAKILTFYSTGTDAFEVFHAELVMPKEHICSTDRGHDFFIQGIDNGGIHACIHHQGHKSPVDDVALGEPIGDIGQAARDMDVRKLCLDGPDGIKDHDTLVGVRGNGLYQGIHLDTGRGDADAVQLFDQGFGPAQDIIGGSGHTCIIHTQGNDTALLA